MFHIVVRILAQTVPIQRLLPKRAYQIIMKAVVAVDPRLVYSSQANQSIAGTVQPIISITLAGFTILRN
jgi:hypothetical protein